MKTIKSELIVYCDVDDTLVIWGSKYNLSSENKIKLQDPYDNSLVYLTPHVKHVKLLGDYKARGYMVVVWSAAGWRWAEVVVKALGLEDTVDYCQSKPIKYVDDLLDANQILGDRVYIPFKE